MNHFEGKPFDPMSDLRTGWSQKIVGQPAAIFAAEEQRRP
jgi:hypothetical protein